MMIAQFCHNVIQFELDSTRVHTTKPFRWQVEWTHQEYENSKKAMFELNLEGNGKAELDWY
jgi:hypothetical protein